MFAAESKLCCILTGASQGFGPAIVLDIAKQSSKTKNSVTFILVARSLEGLEKTKASINEVYSSAKVHCMPADLGNLATLSTSVKNIFEKINLSEFNCALLVNNAGALGDVSKNVRDFEDPQVLQQILSINATAPFTLMSRFLKTFDSIKRYVVSISSLMAVQEYSGFSLYCTSKAANEMLHKVVAKEEPDVRVLCYAPGPLDTDMTKNLVSNTINMEAKTMLTKENLLKTEQSSAKLVHLLLEDKFKSGEHIDYFDC